jgi:hypothetical protein
MPINVPDTKHDLVGLVGLVPVQISRSVRAVVVPDGENSPTSAADGVDFAYKDSRLS